MSRFGSVVPGSLVITLWFLAAAHHLMPPHQVMHGPVLAHYQRWAFDRLAYSDIFALYQHHRLANHHLVYWKTPVEYPVLMGLTMWISAWAPGALGFFTATAALLWVAALSAHYLLYQRSPRNAWTFALTPLLFTYGLLNWDVMGIALSFGALALYRQRYWGWSGALFSAAVFFKLFPLFYLPFIAVQLARDREWPALRRMAAAFGITAAVVNGPAALANWSSWSLFFRYNASRKVGADIWSNALWHITNVPLVDALSLAAVLLAAVFMAREVYRGGSPTHAAAIAFTAFLLVNKVFSPQYMLWLFAFAAESDWPGWTLGALSTAGLVDYVNSLSILHLVGTAPAAAMWYGREIFPLGILARYTAIIAAGVGARLALAAHPTRKTPESPLHPNSPGRVAH